MRNIKAFIIALILCAISAVGVIRYADDALPTYSIEYGTWMDESKYACTEGLDKLLQTKGTLPIFGSSELRHGMKTKFYAKAVFRHTSLKPVLVGQAGYQSLTHAMTMGAVGNSIKEKKAVLIVSPQWFKKGGVKETAFGAAFSEETFIEFLKNDKISDENKGYMIKRVRELTQDNDAMYQKVNNDIDWYLNGKEGALTSIRKKAHTFFVYGKSRTKLMLRKKVLMTKQKRNANPNDHTKEPNWDMLYEKAEMRGKVVSRNNGFGMYDSVYKKGYKKFVEGKAKMKPADYDYNSVEFKDLECFLKMSQNLGVEPMVVILPYNGKWYDYMGLKKEERQAYYKKINSILDEYNVKRADLSSREYADYYFRDNSHLLLKGLVELNEHIYDFFEYDQ